MHKTSRQSFDVGHYLKKRLKSKIFKRYYDDYGKQLEIAYQIAALRRKARLTQVVMAKRIGSTQSNVARMEQGQQNFTVDLLSRVARALNRDLVVTLK